jgi:LPXTG-site transpeptidase (sortase) family protein
MEDLEGNFYKYVIYSIFEIDENDISKVQASDENFKTLTLCTCTANKNKRLVIKAKI